MPLSDFSGIMPQEDSRQILDEVRRLSAAMALGSRVPMGAGVTRMPVPTVFPKAAFVNSATGRKPYTNVAMTSRELVAEDIAAVIAIPDAMADDATINITNYARPLLAEAIAIAIDDAAFYGTGAPPTWPAGGVNNNANSGAPVAPTLDAVETLNLAMGTVEGRGLTVTGTAADTGVKSVFRGVRDANGSLLLGETQVGGDARPTLYGVPASYVQLGSPTVTDLFTGAFKYLVMGVRSDIRIDINPSGVIADDDGKVLVSGWQDNVTPIKAFARIACVIVRPVTPRAPAGAPPFAKAKLVGASYPDPAEASGSARKR